MAIHSVFMPRQGHCSDRWPFRGAFDRFASRFVLPRGQLDLVVYG